jgi:hypothetical protein
MPGPSEVKLNMKAVVSSGTFVCACKTIGNPTKSVSTNNAELLCWGSESKYISFSALKRNLQSKHLLIGSLNGTTAKNAAAVKRCAEICRLSDCRQHLSVFGKNLLPGALR